MPGIIVETEKWRFSSSTIHKILYAATLHDKKRSGASSFCAIDWQEIVFLHSFQPIPLLFPFKKIPPPVKYMTNIYDVAKLAGVSHSTVSRVINEKDKVKDKTRQSVLSAMKMLNYVPNDAATSLASRKSSAIGITVPGLDILFYSGVANRIEQTIRQDNLHLIVATCQRNQTIEKETIQFLQSRMCSVIVVMVEATSDEELVKLFRGKESVIKIGKKVRGLDHSFIRIDEDTVETLATEYLLQMGHRKIARISGNLAIGQQAIYVQERNLGYQRTLEKAGISFNSKLLVDSTFSTEGGYLGTKELLSRKTPFTAILVGNDQMAIGVYSAFNEAGLKIPEDVSIIGHDDSDFARYFFQNYGSHDDSRLWSHGYSSRIV